MGRIAAIVLAAGEATRFGSPKQAVVLPEVLSRLATASIDEIVAVEGAHALLGGGVPHGAPVQIVACKEWALGPGASLRCGLRALGEDVEAAIVVLADGPDLAPASIGRVIARWRAGSDSVVAASYGGVRGHPLLVARPAWAEIPDEGLRLRDPVLVPCDDLGAPGDVDRPGDVPPRLR